MTHVINQVKDSDNTKRFFIIKVFASYLILIFLTVAVLDFFLTPKIKETMTTIIEDEMYGIARIITLMPRDDIESKIGDIAKKVNVRVTLIDPSGKVIADSEVDITKTDNHLNRTEVQQAKTEGQGKATRFSSTLQETMLYVALPIKENNEIKGYVRLARPLVKVSESLKHLYRVISLTLFIIAIPSLVIAFIFSRKIATRTNN
jgi:two-component system, OmpR family, phosphate regulon sensor histidine kinase PhoR